MAARLPLLLIVDDLPWIDRASAGVLSFVAEKARRAAGRDSWPPAGPVRSSYFERAGLPEYELMPLDDEAAAQLVADRFPGLDPQVRNRVLQAAQGNPLALLELPQALTGAQRSGTDPLPSVLPLGQRLQDLFTSRVARTPSGDPGAPPRRRPWKVPETLVCWTRRAVTCYQLDDLAPAERDHLVRTDENSAPGHVPASADPLRGGRGVDR